MNTFDKFLQNVLQDLQVELTDEFDRNFERKAFFSDTWPATSRTVKRGSLLMRSGALRQSIQSRIENNMVVWSSSLPYASIHNNGGKIRVTLAMKKFFWAMYYQASGAISQTAKGKHSNSKKNQLLTAEAAYWKGMALMKLGTEITIPKRQFIGSHAVVDACIKNVVDKEIHAIEQYVTTRLKQNSI